MNQPKRQRSFAGFEEEPAPTPDEPPAAPTPDEPLAAPAPDEALTEAIQPPGPTGLPGESLTNCTVYVVDSHALIYQVFHAMPEMTGPSGQPVGALHGFTRDVLDLLLRKRPDYLFCAFDHSEVTFRNKMYAEYKQHRERMPDDLRLQIPSIYRMLKALGVAVLVAPGFEADDILATVARQVSDRGGQCYLVTSDKDCRQLISSSVQMYNIRKDSFLDSEGLREVWGIAPEQVVDFQALTGDKADNVPGVPLIGPKIAKELLEKYKTLDGVLDHAGEVSGKKRKENLVQFRDQALLSRELVRLVDHVPIEVDWVEGQVGGVDRKAVQALCDEFGFRALADRMGQLTAAEAPVEWMADYRTVATVEDLAALVDQLRGQSRISIDTETTSKSPRWAELVGYSFCWEAGRAVYVPVRAPDGDPCLDPDAARDALRPILEDARIEKVGQNLKYDAIVLRCAGIELRGIAFDTMVADYLLAPGERNHNMDDLSKRYLHHAPTSIRELIGRGKNQKRMDEVPVEQVTHYAAEDADVPWRLTSILHRRLEEEGLDDLFRQLEMPLIEVLADLEYRGIRVDVEHLDRLGKRFAERMEVLRGEIHEYAGRDFNIESPKQLGEVLFQHLGLPVIRRTKTGASTDAEVLTQLAALHPLPRKVIEYRQFATLRSTFVQSLKQLVHPLTGRVHTSFKQDVAATGRLSSTEPNLQNIPVRTEEGRGIRAAFIPGEPGWSLVAADYSQVELRVLAHVSKDAALQTAFREDRDIHAQVAAEVFGVALRDVTPELRRRAKAVNFGVLYGQSPFGLARSLDIDKGDAAAFIDAYFEKYPGVDQFMEKTLADCRQKGYVSTIFGRRRAVEGVRSTSQRGDSRQRNLPERIAINTVIQGTAADLIKRAMIRVHRCLKTRSLQARMLLQIHDELVFEAPADEVSTLSDLVRREMSGAGEFSVPLKVDIKAGPTWADCEPVA